MRKLRSRVASRAWRVARCKAGDCARALGQGARSDGRWHVLTGWIGEMWWDAAVVCCGVLVEWGVVRGVVRGVVWRVGGRGQLVLVKGNW